MLSNLRDALGWDHPDTRAMVRAFCALVVAVTAGQLLAGCGAGGVKAIGNPPGPYPVNLYLAVDARRIVSDQEEAGNDQFVEMVVTLYWDNQESGSEVLRFRADGRGRDTQLAAEFRPGTHSARAVVRWLDQSDEETTSFFVPDRWETTRVDLRL